MEVENVSKEVEWEAKRVAAAFGVESFTASGGHATLTNFYASEGEVSLWWSLDSRREETMLRVLDIKRDSQRCQVSVTNVLDSLTEEDKWVLIDQGVLREEMARWLYRLGFYSVEAPRAFHARKDGAQTFDAARVLAEDVVGRGSGVTLRHLSVHRLESHSAHSASMMWRFWSWLCVLLYTLLGGLLGQVLALLSGMCC